MSTNPNDEDLLPDFPSRCDRYLAAYYGFYIGISLIVVSALLFFSSMLNVPSNTHNALIIAAICTLSVGGLVSGIFVGVQVRSPSVVDDTTEINF